MIKNIEHSHGLHQLKLLPHLCLVEAVMVEPFRVHKLAELSDTVLKGGILGKKSFYFGDTLFIHSGKAYLKPFLDSEKILLKLLFPGVLGEPIQPLHALEGSAKHI